MHSRPLLRKCDYRKRRPSPTQRNSKHQTPSSREVPNLKIPILKNRCLGKRRGGLFLSLELVACALSLSKIARRPLDLLSGREHFVLAAANRPGLSCARGFARAHGMWTYEPRQGRKAATVVCSASAVVTLAFNLRFT